MVSHTPLKIKPLHNPGQSLEQHRDDYVFDKFVTPMLMAALLCVMAFMEWWGYLRHQPRLPWVYTILAIIAVFYALFRYIRLKPQFAQLRLAINGEKFVGQYLDSLREKQYQIFHDVVGQGFNIDHVIIGPAGVFTIETKTYSKPHRKAKIAFDGETILVDGYKPDRDPVIQAKAQANWLKTVLEESTSKKYDVRPVVVFPNWFIEQRPGSTRNIWVLEPKALPGFLAHEPVKLKPEDISLASFHLAQFIRSQSNA